jgi:hypothetical protein
LQLRAHKISIQNFQAMLYGVPYEPPQPAASTAASLLPVAMLLTAMALFLYTILGFSRNDS